jgi:hypothetical protein
MTMDIKPLHLRLAGVLLVLAGATAVVCGIGAWMVSGCCGSPEPPQDGYLLLGGLVAGASWASARWCFARANQGVPD